MLKELFTATIAYRLANMMLPNTKTPTMADIKKGISLIPSFNFYFGEATIAEDGSIIWPTDSKRGLVGPAFGIMEEQTSIALDFMKSLNPEELKKAAIGLYKERQDKDFVFVLGKPPKTLDASFEKLAPWLASQVIFYAMQGIRTLRAHGYPTHFNSGTKITVEDITNFFELPVALIEEVTAGTGEPRDEPSTTSGWDIDTLVSGRELMLGIVEYHKVANMKLAAYAYKEWLDKFTTGADLLKIEVEHTRKQAEDFVNNARSSDISSEFTGQTKAA